MVLSKWLVAANYSCGCGNPSFFKEGGGGGGGMSQARGFPTRRHRGRAFCTLIVFELSNETSFNEIADWGA